MKAGANKAARKLRAEAHSENNHLGFPQKLPIRHGSTAFVWDALARELLGVCLASLKNLGFSQKRLLELSQMAIVGKGEIPTAGKLFEDVHTLGDLATEWTENPSYVDSTGHPKTLPIRGASPSFEALSKKYFGPRPVEEVLTLADRTRVLELVRHDRVAQFSACVMLAGNPLLQLVRSIHSVRWMLSTAQHNGQPKAATTWPDRQVCGWASEEDFADFIGVMRQPIVNLMEMGNLWLTMRATRKKTAQRTKVLMTGIHAYMFQDKPHKTSRCEGPGRKGRRTPQVN